MKSQWKPVRAIGLWLASVQAPVPTEDVDVFVVVAEEGAATLAPLQDVWASLVSNGARQDGQYLVIGDWPVQLLPPSNVLYDDAIRTATVLELDGVPAKIMQAPYLAAIALQTGRAKDHQRVFEFLQQGKVTREALMQIVAAHQLEATQLPFAEKLRRLDRLRERTRQMRGAAAARRPASVTATSRVLHVEHSARNGVGANATNVFIGASASILNVTIDQRANRSGASVVFVASGAPAPSR